MFITYNGEFYELWHLHNLITVLNIEYWNCWKRIATSFYFIDRNQGLLLVQNIIV